MRYVTVFFALFYLLYLSTPSSADIYRYVDERGVIHFTNCPQDPKFKPYLRESKEAQVETRTVSLSPAIPLPSGKTSEDYDSLISECCEKYQVDSALIKAMIRAESGFNPRAISKKGAKGLMQLMPETALRMNVSNVFSPKENIEGGVRYFKYLLSLFNNDLRLSLAAYNAGENLVSTIRTIPPYRETVDYVRKVLNFYQSYKQTNL